MPDLNCTVVNCAYNKTERCCKDNIKVDGARAKITEETCCSSFKNRNSDSFRNVSDTPKSKIRVTCEAKECCYNENCDCKAESIGITGRHACDCKETECATFRCKC